jgi:ubiquitin-conjugating enzyme E2 M
MEEAPKRRFSPCVARLQKDFDEIKPASHPGVGLIFPDPNDIQVFVVRIAPPAGIWANGLFDFRFTIPDDFPFTRPSVKCETRIWHPNIEETGAVCLNILRDNYTPVMSISQLVVGLQFLFSEPNADSPLNKEAAEQYTSAIRAFTVRAHQYMRKYCPRS